LNFIQALQKTDITKFVEILQGDETSMTVANSDVVETYGSVIRAFPRLVTNPQLISSIQRALNQDRDLYIRLNAVDYWTLIIDAIEEVSGIAAPTSCLDMVVQPSLDAFKLLGVDLLIKGDEETRNKFAESLANGALASFSQCMAEVTIDGICAGVTEGPGAVPCQILNSLVHEVIGTAGLLIWSFDNSIVSTLDILNNDAYAEWQLSPAPIIINLSGTWSGSLYQPSGKGSTIQYTLVLNINQTNNSVTGTRKVQDGSYYALFSISGSITGNKVDLVDGSLMENFPPPGYYWCFISQQLQYVDGSPPVLNGTWTSSDCGGNESGNIVAVKQ
jgi:hypothetical protein